jgi:hypothetical protein
MPLIAMNREMGSLGKDVARGLEEALGLKVRHHEIIDHLASALLKDVPPRTRGDG